MASATSSSMRLNPPTRGCAARWPATPWLRAIASKRTSAASPRARFGVRVIGLIYLVGCGLRLHREIQAMRDLKTFLSAVALGTALVVSAVPAAAQTGRIGGTIKDTQNQPLKGATVTAEN